jgi:hypothetical protein
LAHSLVIEVGYDHFTLIEQTLHYPPEEGTAMMEEKSFLRSVGHLLAVIGIFDLILVFSPYMLPIPGIFVLPQTLLNICLWMVLGAVVSLTKSPRRAQTLLSMSKASLALFCLFLVLVIIAPFAWH